MARCKCGLDEAYKCHHDKERPLYHPFEPEDAAPAPKRDAYEIALEREEFGDYRHEPSPQAEKGGERVSEGGNLSSMAYFAMAKEQCEAGARVAGACDWPFVHECQGVMADCLAANRCLKNLPEPVAQPGAGGEPERCAVCGWPLAESVEKGCVRGNCSMRPLPEQAYEPERANAEYGKPYFALRPAAPAEQPVGCIHCGIGPNMATELDCKEGHCHEFRPAAEQVNAEQFSVEHWKRWFVGKSFPVDMNQFWKDCMEAYAAHVTKGLQAALEDANSLCRSAKSIAERKGLQTNWDAFNRQLEKSLKRQHRVMYPNTKQAEENEQ